MKAINNRLDKLEVKTNSPYVMNCLTDQDLIRFEELISKKDHTRDEFQELIELDNKAQRDAKDEFIRQYDIVEPLNLRSVFNAYQDFQRKHGRVNHLGHAITCCYLEFTSYLKNKGYEITE